MLSFAILASYSFDCCNESIRTIPIVRRGVYPIDMGGYGFKRLRLIFRQVAQLQLQAPVSLHDARGRKGWQTRGVSIGNRLRQRSTQRNVRSEPSWPRCILFLAQ